MKFFLALLVNRFYNWLVNQQGERGYVMETKCDKSVGKRLWVFPDGELPPPGEFPIKGHESLIMLNTNKSPAEIEISLYFSDKEAKKGIKTQVEGERVLCIRLDNPDQLQGVIIPREEQYSIVVESSLPIVAQYGRLDTRDQPMAFYTTPGYWQ